ncbi:sorbitol operon transcription regulator [Cutibacterium acnes JCM 18920]|nr:sorbitol operon transcription regulator [Cutibacterium acnes JCM 18920]
MLPHGTKYLMLTGDEADESTLAERISSSPPPMSTSRPLPSATFQSFSSARSLIPPNSSAGCQG